MNFYVSKLSPNWLSCVEEKPVLYQTGRMNKMTGNAVFVNEPASVIIDPSRIGEGLK